MQMVALKGLLEGLPRVFAMGLPKSTAKHQDNAFESLEMKNVSLLVTATRNLLKS